jgi:outer membrane protein
MLYRKWFLKGMFYLVGISFSISTLAQRSFSLDEAIAYARVHSPVMKLSDAEIALTNTQIMEYRSIGIPKVNAVGSYTYYFAIPTQILPDFLGPAVDGRLLQYDLINEGQVAPPSVGGFAAQFGTRNSVNMGIEANFMVFDPAFFAGLKAVKNARNLSLHQKDNQEYVLKSNVIAAYIALAYNKMVRESLEGDILNAKKSLKESMIIFESGFIEELDVNRLEYTLSMLETEYDNMSEFIHLSENLLKYQMNFPMKDPIAITEGIEELTARFNNDQVVAGIPTRPEIKVLESSQKLIGLQIEATRAGYYPVLKGFAAYNTQLLRNDLFNSNENNWFPASYAGVSLNVPIYDGSMRKAQISGQKVKLEKLNIQRTQLESGIQMEIDNARISLNNALKTLENRQKNKELADKIYNVAQIKFKEGVGSSLEMTQAETDQYRSQTGLLEAKFKVLNARFDLMKALGKI